MKNKDYMKILRLIPVLCLVAFSACKDPMDRYYNDDKYKTAGQPLIEELKKNPQYSTFTLLLEETKFLEPFNKAKVILTMWVPLNDYMPAEVLTLTNEEKVRLLKNHISITSVNTEALLAQSKTGGKIASLSGRYMPVQYNNGIFYVDGIELLNTDITCSNGIIHEISEWFLPRVTLYDYVAGLDGDYTVFRDSLLGRDITSFDKDSSVAYHVDEFGVPVWEKVYKTTNNILDYADLKDITKTFTLFVPTNDAIAGMYRDMSNYLLAANYIVTPEDSARWMDWLMRTCIQPTQRTWVPNSAWSNSLWVRNDTDPEKSKWEVQSLYTFRTQYQEIYETNPTKYLNGWSYVVNKVRVPKTMYVKYVEFNPYFARNAVGGMVPQPDGLDWWVGNVQTTGTGPQESPQGVFIQFGRAGFVTDGQEQAYYGYKSASMVDVVDEMTGIATPELQPLSIMPGYYDVGIRFTNKTLDTYANETDSVMVRINGSEFKVKGITKNTYNTDDSKVLVVRDFHITGQYDPVTVEIELFPTDEQDATKYRAWRRIQVGLTRLYPASSESNFM